MKHQVSFISPFSPSPISWITTYRVFTSRTRPPLPARISRPPARCAPKMLGPFFPDLSSTKLMKSEIVRNEMSSLDRDYRELSQLGARYETFDREGKIIFIERALDVVDRYSVMLTRLKLSEEFSAQMFIKQYTLQLQQYGFTVESLVANTRKSLEMMRQEIDRKAP